MKTPRNIIRIAVSSCLAGNFVRYDGTHKKNDAVLQLCSHFDCVTVCPESAIGLGTPRPPLNIISTENSFRARGKTNPSFDVTDSLLENASQFVANHGDICGFVFKSRSPSCGLNSTPWSNLQGDSTGVTSGIFSTRIQQLLPSVPMIEETQLSDSNKLNEFIEKVIDYATSLKRT